MTPRDRGAVSEALKTAVLPAAMAKVTERKPSVYVAFLVRSVVDSQRFLVLDYSFVPLRPSKRNDRRETYQGETPKITP